MGTNKISGAEAVIRCLLEEGVNLVYGYPGGAIACQLYKFKMNCSMFCYEQGNMLHKDMQEQSRKSRGA
jgi:thiamine pyrophosphate-dependent acetolactate synthase large subunit-like protein